MLHPRTQNALIETLATVEGIREHHGWGSAPDLLALFHLPTSAYPDLVHYDFPVSPAMWHHPETGKPEIPPLAALHRVADALNSAPMRAWLRDWLHKDGRRCIGFAMILEGPLAQSPASTGVEARVVAVDLDLRVYRAIRVRDAQTPSITTWAVTPPGIRDTHLSTELTRLVHLARAL
ncbi:hypothetical protein ACIA59_24370 [Micromonospora haikouensis]|uniref:hypothetical protein n=1 Tax=Micromonospora haikouensis TaxID=686309 RepID=UPI00378947A1